jgi:hypothetical protein
MNKQAKALVHLAWYRDGKERHLVFGWIEVFPDCFPPMRGHSHLDFRSKRRGPCLHVARFPMSAVDAREWYNQAKNGHVYLPSHPDKVSPGDGAPIATSILRPEPEEDGESNAIQLVFLPAMQGTVIARGLFGDVPPQIMKEIRVPTSRSWLIHNLFFDLNVHQEYLGGIFLVCSQPVVRDVASLRSVAGGHELALVRIRRWPGKNLSGHRLMAVERRTLGYSTPQEQPAESQLLRVVHAKKQELTAAAIMHPQYGVCWLQEPTPWLRTIVTNMSFASEKRRIIQEMDGAGSASRYYDVQRYENAFSMVSGDVPDERSPSLQWGKAEANRRQSALATSLGLRWFDDPTVAQEAVRKIINGATQYVTIFDPYFGPQDVQDFAMAISRREVEINIFTSAKGFGDDNKVAHMKSILEITTSRQLAKLCVKVMWGKQKLHDRFIIADGRVWLSGNSLNRIGEKASMLIEVPNPDDIIGHLTPFARNTKLFSDWLSDRLQARRRKCEVG